MSSSSCPCLRLLVLALSLNLGTWTSTRERILRGWVRWQCIAIATFCCLRGNNVDRVSHFFWVAINSFAASFWVRCDTVGFYHCVLGKSFVVVSVGLLPRSLFALLSFGWWDANLAGGSASCLVFLWFVFWFLWFAKLHATTCVHVEVFLIIASSHVRTEP